MASALSCSVCRSRFAHLNERDACSLLVHNKCLGLTAVQFVYHNENITLQYVHAVNSQDL